MAGCDVPGSCVGGGCVTVEMVVMVEPPGSVVVIIVGDGVGVGVEEVVELVDDVVDDVEVVGVVVVVVMGGGDEVGGKVVGEEVEVFGGAVVPVLVEELEVVGLVGDVDGSAGPGPVLFEDMAKVRRLSRGYSLYGRDGDMSARILGYVIYVDDTW